MDYENKKPLQGHTVLITGAARRLGRFMALAVANAGGNVVIHYNNSKAEAKDLQSLLQEQGAITWLVSADLSDLNGIQRLGDKAFSLTPVTDLINNASIFQNFSFAETTSKIWQDHLQVNLTVPFILSQIFARQINAGSFGRIINMLDWRALRPGKDHFAYSISKAGLASMTQSLALALAPQISVNAIALELFFHRKMTIWILQS